jgi:hypothetical protein
LLSLDAIVRSLVRRFITGKRLLEWETAAQSESNFSNRTPVDRYLTLMPFLGVGLGALVYFFAPQRNAIVFAAPVLLLWALAHTVTVWLNRPPREQPQRMGRTEEVFLVSHALRAWRYFHQFGGESHNHLIPDNVEEDGLSEASRVSPTNLGLLLNARQAACQFGFLTVPEFAALTARTLATITKLEKHRGHLYNWYDTQSLAPLPPLTISSVDSGNLVASLYTVRSGALALGRQPLLARQLFTGLRAHWHMIQLQKELFTPLARFSIPGPSASVAEWIALLPAADAALTAVAANAGQDDRWWLAETQRRVTAILTLLYQYAPWLLPAYLPLRDLPELDLNKEGDTLSIDAAIAFSEILDARLARTTDTIHQNSPLLPLCEQLRASLPEATRKLRGLADDLRAIARRAENFAEEMGFSFLVDPDRRMLSVGFDVVAQQLHPACYDMLASEARIATFLSAEELAQSWPRSCARVPQLPASFLDGHHVRIPDAVPLDA